MPPDSANNFFGIKVSKTGVPVQNASDNQLIYKSDFSTDTWFGTNSAIMQQGSFDNGTYGLRILDSNGDVVSQFGEQSDGSSNLKFFDASGIGIAQFGRFADGTTALKVAKNGQEVSTATNAQLSFNSQTSYTVLLQGSHTFPSLGSVVNDGFATSSVITIPHNAGFIPNVNCFAPLALGAFTSPTIPSGFPITDVSLVANASVITQADSEFFNFYYVVDSANLYLGLGFANSSGGTVTAQAVTVYYTVFALSLTS